MTDGVPPPAPQPQAPSPLPPAHLGVDLHGLPGHGCRRREPGSRQVCPTHDGVPATVPLPSRWRRWGAEPPTRLLYSGGLAHSARRRGEREERGRAQARGGAGGGAEGARPGPRGRVTAPPRDWGAAGGPRPPDVGVETVMEAGRQRGQRAGITPGNRFLLHHKPSPWALSIPKPMATFVCPTAPEHHTLFSVCCVKYTMVLIFKKIIKCSF